KPLEHQWHSSPSGLGVPGLSRSARTRMLTRQPVGNSVRLIDRTGSHTPIQHLLSRSASASAASYARGEHEIGMTTFTTPAGTSPGLQAW
ncbi:MAG: hypothetical protein ABWX92_07210, partial [Mycetocola sp.]